MIDHMHSVLNKKGLHVVDLLIQLGFPAETRHSSHPKNLTEPTGHLQTGTPRNCKGFWGVRSRGPLIERHTMTHTYLYIYILYQSKPYPYHRLFLNVTGMTWVDTLNMSETRNAVQSELLFLDLAVFWKRLTRTSNFPAAKVRFQRSIPYIPASIVCFILDFPDRKNDLIWPYLTSKSRSIVNNLKSFQAFARWWFQICFHVHPYLGKWSNLINIFKWVETTN